MENPKRINERENNRRNRNIKKNKQQLFAAFRQIKNEITSQLLEDIFSTVRRAGGKNA